MVDDAKPTGWAAGETWTLRLFISSTFSDLAEERNSLQRTAIPDLANRCADLGGRLQVVDLRWGVAEDVSRDQRTIEVCLAEIARSQRISPWLNFLIIVGDRYGWRPLPAAVTERHGRLMRRRMTPGHRTLFDRWYGLDGNARPTEFRLLGRAPRPHPAASADAADPEAEFDRTDSTWESDEPALHAAMEQAGYDLPADERRRYFASATEQEIGQGAFAAEARGPVFCYIRAESSASTAGATGPSDALLALTDQLRGTPRVRIRSFGRAGPADPPAPLSSLVFHDVAEQIQRYVEQATTADPVVAEAERHRAAAERSCRDFTGRPMEVRDLTAAATRSAGRPVIVTGPSGVGKSALLAEVARRVAEFGDGRVVLRRIIGSTSSSGNERSLVEGICQEIDLAYGRTDRILPSDPRGLARALTDRMQDLPVDRPLVLILDAIDQLAGSARPLLWLPAVPPAGVSVLLSTASTTWLAEQQRRFPTMDTVELEPLTDDSADHLLERWLDRAGRALTPEQKPAVLRAFSASRLPLHLRLAFEEARRWPSFLTPVPKLSDDPRGIVRDRLAVLAADHGPIFLDHALGFLGAARAGLADDEVVGVLSADRAVTREIGLRSPHSPSIAGLPPVLWYRLAGDLRPYLTERSAPGGPLVTFSHQLIASAVRSTRAGPTEERHAALADYFIGAADSFDPRHPRPLVELPYQLAGAGRLAELGTLLTDINFLEAKLGLGDPGAGLDGGGRHDGVYQLLDDLDLAIEAATDAGAGSPAGTVRLADLRALATALRLESSTLVRRPRLARQQLVNRLRWTAPQLAEAFREAPGEPAAWLRVLNPPRDPPALRWTLTGHDRLAECLMSADGRLIIGGGLDRTITVWDRSSGRVVAELIGHQRMVTAFALTRDGQRLVSAGNDGTLRT